MHDLAAAQGTRVPTWELPRDLASLLHPAAGTCHDVAVFGRPRWQVFAVAVALAAARLFHGRFGPTYELELLYLLPVVAFGYGRGPHAGALVGFCAGCLWAWARIAQGGEWPALVHDILTRVIVFGAAGWGSGALGRARHQLADLSASERVLARSDALTNLENGRAFRDHLAQDLARAARENAVLSVLSLDLDNFKQVNARYGHVIGDELLVLIAQVIRASLRAGDRAARLGGDEFAVLLWNVDARSGAAVATRIIAAIRTLGQQYPQANLAASAGIADTRSAVTPEALVQTADAAMYRAKAAGKGVVCAD